MMALPEELMLLALDDEKGTVSGWTASSLDLGLAGAALCDLVLAGRVEFTEYRIVVRDDTPTGHRADDAALAKLAEREKPRKAANWIGPLSRGLRKEVLASLEEQGLVRAERGRVLGVLPTTRYPESDPSVERALRERVRGVLVDGAEPDDRTAALIAIAHASQLGRALVDDVPWSQVKARTKAIAKSDWAAEAVRKSIDGVNAAVTAATVAATAAAVGGS